MTTQERMNNAQIDLSICLSDVKESKKITKAQNGKLYFNVTVRAKKEKDQYGKDVYCFVSTTKDERTAAKEAGQELELKFCGNGSLFQFEGSESMPAATDADMADFEKDLPF